MLSLSKIPLFCQQPASRLGTWVFPEAEQEERSIVNG